MKKKHLILIIEKDGILADKLEKSLSGTNYKIEKAHSGFEALQMLKLYKFNLAVLDQDITLLSSSYILKNIKKSNIQIPIIVLVDKAKEKKENLLFLMKDEIDYLVKPIELDTLIEKIDTIIYSEDLVKEVQNLRNKLKADFRIEGIIGKCDKMYKVFTSMKKIVESDVTVCISGESGTGKELVAREIHRNSLRNNNVFIPINCAAIPDTLLESELFGHEKGSFTGAYSQKQGKFELAHKGTLFLDEIGDMSMHLQSKILRVIEKQQFLRVGGSSTINADVRIITATNKILKDEVERGNFRKDLFYRINVYPIALPPLRERIEDIPLLISYFIKKLSKKNNKNIYSITQNALETLKNYSWPGNVRELENVLERAILVCSKNILRSEDFTMQSPQNNRKEPDEETNFSGDIVPLEKIEKRYLEHAVRKSNGNLSQAAKQLKIGRATLYRKLQKYKINFE